MRLAVAALFIQKTPEVPVPFWAAGGSEGANLTIHPGGLHAREHNLTLRVPADQDEEVPRFRESICITQISGMRSFCDRVPGCGSQHSFLANLDGDQRLVPAHRYRSSSATRFGSALCPAVRVGGPTGRRGELPPGHLHLHL